MKLGSLSEFLSIRKCSFQHGYNSPYFVIDTEKIQFSISQKGSEKKTMGTANGK
jgi:hypothetical protein